LNNNLRDLTVVIKGGGEIASAIAHRLTRAGFRVCMTEVPIPLAVHRGSTYCEAVFDGEKTVEGLTAKLATSFEQVKQIWDEGKIPVIVDIETRIKDYLKPQVLIDATMLKNNTTTRMDDAPLVIGVGPGFHVGQDVHLIVESYHDENLGKVLTSGTALPNTGIPLAIGGYVHERAFHAGRDGKFTALIELGDMVKPGDIIGEVDGEPLVAEIGGVLRAVLRSDISVKKDTKLAEIDPEATAEVCFIIRGKMRAIAGGVLEAILMKYNN
jgi:xanthine dehydrogenase accessory factor